MKTNPLTTCETAVTPIIHTKSRIVKNVAVLCVGALCLFTSCDCLLMLQSTMNSKHGVGVMAQAVLYIFYCISSLLFPKYVIKKLGSKLTCTFAILTYIPFIASNFYPHWALMIPAAIVLGIGSPLLWGSQDNYLNDVSFLYAALLTSEDSKHCQIGKGSFGKESNRQPDSHFSSVNCVPVAYEGMASYKKFDRHHESGCRCINIESECVPNQSENHEEKHQNLNVAVITLPQESDPSHIRVHPFSSERRSSGPHNTEKFRVGRFTSSSTIGDGLNKLNSNEISEVTTMKNRKKSTESTTVPSFLGSNQIQEKDSNQNRTSSNFPSQNDANYRAKVHESTTARFFGIHGLVYLSSKVWSNLMSYYVLSGDEHDYGMIRNSSCECGADFCNGVSTSCLQESMQLPSDSTRYLLTGVCICFAVVSFVVIFLFLDPVEVEKEDVTFSLDLVAATFRLAKTPDLLLLMPASIFLGMVQGFYEGEFNKSYVGCAWGSTSQVGPMAICYGITCAFSSLASGWAVKLAGRPAIFTIAAVINAATCILLLEWVPDLSQPVIFFVTAGILGCYDGILWSQLRGLYGVLFHEDEEAAFATFHMWFSLGYCFSFAYTNFFCTSLKIYVLLAVSTVGFAGYLNVERRHAAIKK